MLLPGTRGQQQRDLFYDASGTITTGGTTQLLLPERKSTSFLFIQNISAYDMYIKFGSAKATAVLTNGVVTSITMNDVGFNFTLPPTVQFLGGGGVAGWNYNDGRYVGCSLPQWPVPNNFAVGRAILASSAISGKQVSSIEIDNPGSKYLQPPYISIMNNFNDPLGCGIASATSGAWLNAGGGSWTQNGTMCPTDPISIYCATSASPFTCYWSP